MSLGWDALVRAGARELAEAGIDASRADAESLAAHAAGVPLDRLRRLVLLDEPPVDGAPESFAALIAERADRVPLQHLTGEAAFRGHLLRVGPGVFIPRPETELIPEVLAELAPEARRLVDLCTGSGALALSLGLELHDARVLAVELDTGAHAWAERNLDDHRAALTELRSEVTLVQGDAADPLLAAELRGLLGGEAEAVVANPPYIASGMVPIDAEVRDHDPAAALYGGGEDGLRIPRGVIALAADVLQTSGLLICEHGSEQGESMRRSMRHGGRFDRVETRADLTGRDRFTLGFRTAIRRDP